MCAKQTWRSRPAFILSLFVLVGGVMGLLLALVTHADEMTGHGAKLGDQWVVVLPDPRSARRKGGAAGFGYAGRTQYAADPLLNRVAQRIVRDHELQLVTQWPIDSLNVHCVVVHLPRGEYAAAILKDLRKDPRVESVQRLNEFTTLSNSGADPFRTMQPALDSLNLSGLHGFVTGAGVSVAMVDSAADESHPELRRVIRIQQDLVDDDARPMRAEHHGTGVAGIIAAATNNGEGISGIAPDIKLLSFRACWQSAEDATTSRCNTLTLSRALDRVIQRKPDILNLSLSGPADPLLERMVSRLVEQGVIIVTAYDEHRPQTERFPRVRDGVFFARDQHREGASSNLWWVPAPANEVLTSQPGGSYDFVSGNSVAAAHVTGAIALMLDAQPRMAAAEVHTALSQHFNSGDDTLAIDLCATLQQINRAITCKA